MDCPFCRSESVALPTEGYDGEFFDCPLDGKIKLARGVRARLDKMNQHGRDLALGQVKPVSGVREFHSGSF